MTTNHDSTTVRRRKARSALITAGLLGGVVATTTMSATQVTAASADSHRVDTARPVFSHPTEITNPLFPVNDTEQFVQLGREGTEVLRHELTLIADTRVIDVDGAPVEARVTQFMAYANGRLIEIAIDYFAQDDSGSVWYLGEDVTNYADGVVLDHKGTWLAGRDGPPGMIMPANPHAGDVYRPETIPGLVFEETTVDATGLTVDGPRGPVSGAIRVTERSPGVPDEVKVFAPGYGEFQTDVADGDEHTGIALSIDIDERDGPAPRELARIAGAARRVFDAAPRENWNRLQKLASTASRASAGLPSDNPPRLQAQMDDAVAALTDAVSARDVAATQAAAIAVRHAEADLAEQYIDVDETDMARLTNWRLQLQLDRAAGNQPGVLSDQLIIAAISDRTPYD